MCVLVYMLHYWGESDILTCAWRYVWFGGDPMPDALPDITLPFYLLPYFKAEGNRKTTEKVNGCSGGGCSQKTNNLNSSWYCYLTVGDLYAISLPLSIFVIHNFHICPYFTSSFSFCNPRPISLSLCHHSPPLAILWGCHWVIEGEIKWRNFALIVMNHSLLIFKGTAHERKELCCVCVLVCVPV